LRRGDLTAASPTRSRQPGTAIRHASSPLARGSRRLARTGLFRTGLTRTSLPRRGLPRQAPTDGVAAATSPQQAQRGPGSLARRSVNASSPLSRGSRRLARTGLFRTGLTRTSLPRRGLLQQAPTDGVCGGDLTAASPTRSRQPGTAIRQRLIPAFTRLSPARTRGLVSYRSASTGVPRRGLPQQAPTDRRCGGDLTAASPTRSRQPGTAIRQRLIPACAWLSPAGTHGLVSDRFDSYGRASYGLPRQAPTDGVAAATSPQQAQRGPGSLARRSVNASSPLARDSRRLARTGLFRTGLTRTGVPRRGLPQQAPTDGVAAATSPQQAQRGPGSLARRSVNASSLLSRGSRRLARTGLFRTGLTRTGVPRRACRSKPLRTALRRRPHHSKPQRGPGSLARRSVNASSLLSRGSRRLARGGLVSCRFDSYGLARRGLLQQAPTDGVAAATSPQQAQRGPGSLARRSVNASSLLSRGSRRLARGGSFRAGLTRTGLPRRGLLQQAPTDGVAAATSPQQAQRGPGSLARRSVNASSPLSRGSRRLARGGLFRTGLPRTGVPRTGLPRQAPTDGVAAATSPQQAQRGPAAWHGDPSTPHPCFHVTLADWHAGASFRTGLTRTGLPVGACRGKPLRTALRRRPHRSKPNAVPRSLARRSVNASSPLSRGSRRLARRGSFRAGLTRTSLPRRGLPRQAPTDGVAAATSPQQAQRGPGSLARRSVNASSLLSRGSRRLARGGCFVPV
jgi:hypothetical protein